MVNSASDEFVMNDDDISHIKNVCNTYNTNININKNMRNIIISFLEKDVDFIISPKKTHLHLSVPIKNSDCNYSIKFYNKHNGLSYLISMIKYYMDDTDDFSYTPTPLSPPTPPSTPILASRD